ncbi:MAG: hypothetical protein HRT61_13270 [Ekhidna sp.]|nr:hypothetical protein [Ekhidna sp.]
MTYFTAGLFYLLTSLSICSERHAIYLSVTEIALFKNNAELNIKVFSDDLRDVLKNYDASQYQSGDLQTFYSLNVKLSSAYFNQFFKMESQAEEIQLEHVGYHIENDAHFIQFHCSLPEQTSLTLNAQFFMELFPTQINVVKIRKGEQQQYLKFTKSSDDERISFSN